MNRHTLSFNTRGCAIGLVLLPLLVLLEIPAYGQSTGTVDAQAAISQPQTLTFSGTNLPGTGGQGACASAVNVNIGGSATGVGNRTTFTLNVANATTAFYQTYNTRLTLELTWTPASGDPATQDLELLFDGFANQSDNSLPREFLAIDNVTNGSHTITVCDILVLLPQSFTVKVTFEARTKDNPFPQPTLPPAPLASVTAPRYQNHTPAAEQIAQGMGKNSSDEPNIGVNWRTGSVFFQALLQTLRVQFDDACQQTPASRWENKSPLTSQRTFDPILFADHDTGLVVVSQLGFNPIVGLSSVSLDDGETWIPSQGSGINSGIDHQSVGGGPYHQPVPPNAVYPNAVYYCSQDLVMAQCALSLDAGVTYGPAIPIYTSECGGLHGHVKVGPDGTVYVPNRSCKGSTARQQAVVVSEDNGLTWRVRTVEGSLPGASDPSVSVDARGRLYMGFIHNNHIPAVAVSDDKGLTWRNLYAVGTQLGIKNAVFPAVIAGDAGRAAFAFYGTAAEGNVDSFRFPPATWHLYVAHTYDGGDSWVTVDATPNDPLQRGGIRLGGGGAIHRNLLDFFDADIDAQGRVLVGYADGCRGACVQAADSARGNSYGAFAVIARQSGGQRLVEGADLPGQTVPGAPWLTVTRNGSLASLTWSQSDDGGSPISGYRVLRREGSGPEQPLVSLPGTANSYIDQSGHPAITYSYRVVAANSLGESCGTNAVTAAPVGTSCAAPGWRALEDAGGDHTGAPLNPDLDIQWVSVAEPYAADGSRKLTFRLKVASLAALQPDRMWRIIWNYPDVPAAGQPGANGAGFAGRYYLGMDTNETGAVLFSYGFLGVDTTAVLVDLAPPFPLGTPDAAGFEPDGTITFTIAADKVGSPGAGDLIGGILARAWPVRNEETLRGDTAADTASLGSTYMLVGNAFCQNPPPTINCFEDDDAHVSYTKGWHLVNSSGASGGHFRYHTGSPQNGMSFGFEVSGSANGALTYHYAKSAEGGAADVYIDGVFRETVSYLSSSGTNKNPEFGFSARYEGLAPGAHVFQLRNVKGPAFVDRFCLENSFFTGTSAEGPGDTTSVLNVLYPLVEMLQTVQVPAGAQAISIAAESSDGSPVRVLLVDPVGLVVATAEGAAGAAVIERAVSLPGAYVVKVVNTGSAAAEVWTLITPWGTR